MTAKCEICKAPAEKYAGTQWGSYCDGCMGKLWECESAEVAGTGNAKVLARLSSPDC